MDGAIHINTLINATPMRALFRASRACCSAGIQSCCLGLDQRQMTEARLIAMMKDDEPDVLSPRRALCQPEDYYVSNNLSWTPWSDM